MRINPQTQAWRHENTQSIPESSASAFSMRLAAQVRLLTDCSSELTLSTVGKSAFASYLPT